MSASAYHFESTDHTVDGRNVYQIVNDEPRRLPLLNMSIEQGTRGGYVENPELLLGAPDLWVAANAAILGETSINGSCIVQRATIYDTTIKGKVIIGNKRIRKLGDDAILRVAPKRLIIRGSRLDSRAAYPALGLPGNDKDIIRITGRVYIYEAQIVGASAVNGISRVISSSIYDSTVTDAAMVSRSTLSSHSRIKGSSLISRSHISSCTIGGNIIIETSSIQDMVLTGDHHIVENKFRDEAREG